MSRGRLVRNIMETDINFSTSVGGLIAAAKVLVLAPHEDDEVIGCGGTILRYIEVGSEVTIVYLTDGRYGIIDEKKDIRREEAKLAWTFQPVKQIFLEYEDSHLYESGGCIWLKEFIQEFKPEVILTPWILDTHIDHKTTSYFLSSVLQQIDNENILVGFYEVMFPLYANKIINITKQFDRKLKILEAYKSQLNYLDLREIVITTNTLRAHISHFKAIKKAEAFYFCSVEVYMRLIETLCREI